LLIISNDFKYVAYHFGCQCYISSLSKNRMHGITQWSMLAEAIRYLDHLEFTHKKDVIKEQLLLMKCPTVGEVVYSPDAIVRAFQYFACSRALYKRLREDYQLPSIRKLTTLTSKASKLNDDTFISKVFSKLAEKQRSCVLMVDEVYVKASLCFHGGELFGKAYNNEEQLAKTVLAIMIKCLFGGPTFIVKMLPVYKLNSDFQFDSVSSVIDSISAADGNVVAIICDNNKVNVKMFRRFHTVPDQPWLTTKGIFLLFDYVHIMKNVRNNWITEKCQEIRFKLKHGKNDIDFQFAKWEHIRKLWEHEAGKIFIYKL
jgi:hypothetical protein